MVTVTLHGQLGVAVKRDIWKLLVSSVGEAMRAIEANTGKLYSYLAEKDKEGTVMYRVLINGVDFATMEDLYVPTEKIRTIDVVPVPAGSAGGIWQAIIGVVLIVVGIFLPATWAIAASILINIGVALVLGGIASLIAGSPRQSTNPQLQRDFTNKEGDEEKDKKANYLFSGAVNTTRQGNCVPLGYGRLIIGSQIISFGITTIKVTYEAGDLGAPPDNNPFMSLPFWAVYEADSRAAYVGLHRQVKNYVRRDVATVADIFDLRTNGHDGASAEQLRHKLYILVKLFSGPHDEIKFADLRNLYRWLGLTELGGEGNVRWEDYVTAITHYYLPGTPV